MSFSSIQDFVEPVNLDLLSKDEGYRDTQLGKHILVNQGSLPDITNADIVIMNDADTIPEKVEVLRKTIEAAMSDNFIHNPYNEYRF